MASSTMSERVNDEEINRLEDIRRLGPPNDRMNEDIYYKLPPRREDMMRDWTQWRIQVNDLMADIASGQDDGRIVNIERKLLTSSKNKKTPNFFKGDMSIHGLRAKDEYGALVVQDNDDNETKAIKQRIDENFYLFGIPRISLQRGSGELKNVNARSSVTSRVSHNRVGRLEDMWTTDRRSSLPPVGASQRTLSMPVIPSGKTVRSSTLPQRQVDQQSLYSLNDAKIVPYIESQSRKSMKQQLQVPVSVHTPRRQSAGGIYGFKTVHSR